MGIPVPSERAYFSPIQRQHWAWLPDEAVFSIADLLAGPLFRLGRTWAQGMRKNVQPSHLDSPVL